MASWLGSAAHARTCAAYFGIKYRTPDPWAYGSNPYEFRKYARTLDAANERPWLRALEIGCGEGVFTAALADGAPRQTVVGVDISTRAIARARERFGGTTTVHFEVGDAFAALPAGPFDLVICAEILYYAGSRIPALARAVAGALDTGGRLVLVHPWPEADALHAPFRARPEFTGASDRIETDPARAYAITVLERR